MLIQKTGNITSVITTSSIIDNLNSASTTDSLSANQGKILNETKATILDCFPIGTIYTTVDGGLDPEEAFGGTWSLLASTVIDTEWQNFSYTDANYIGTSQSSYTMNKWRVKDNVLFIHIGAGATSIIDTGSEIDIAKIPIVGGFDEGVQNRIWSGAVGGSGAYGGFSVRQDATEIAVTMKPHTAASGQAAPWFSSNYAIPMSSGFTISSGTYEKEYKWKRLS